MAALAQAADHRAALRAQIERMAEASLDRAHRLIALLDDLDGDPCLEAEEPDATAREWSGARVHRYDMGEAA